MAGQSAVELAHINKQYPGSRRTAARAALQDVSLAIPAGQRIALLGPNGAGKSTLLKLLSLSLAPDSGRITALGVELSPGMSDRQRRTYLAQLGVVFQHPGLDGLLTVRENLVVQASLMGITGARRDARLATLAAQLAFADRMNDPVRTLSGGLARRVDLARAILHTPRFLLLDEATTGLDPAARSSFLDVIETLAPPPAPCMTVLMSTHLIDEAQRADRVVMLSAGRIVADDSPMNLRAALGEHILRVPVDQGPRVATAGAHLEALGLRRSPPRSGQIVFACDPGKVSVLEQGAALLVREGLAFEVGPPTLGDAYLQLTGESLTTVPEVQALRRKPAK